MPLLNGKQLQNTSVTLNKMYGTGSLVLQTGAVLQLPTVNIVNPTDVVNKAYVDGVAIGMNVHLACRVATTGTVSLTTGTVSPIIDGVTMSYNDRILVWQQQLAGGPGTAFNGIYVFTGLTAGATGTFSRATDMDGSTPFDTPTIGDYTFITSGNTLAGNGYVIVPSGTYSSGLLTPLNVAPVVWSLFTGPGVFVWGNGLNNTGNTINVELAGGGGLTFSATNLTIDSAIAGNGLAWSAGVINVNVSNGLSIITDTVQVDNSIAGTGLSFSAGILNIKNTAVTPSTYGSTNSVSSVTFNAQGQAIAATAVSIVLQSGNITNFTASAISSALASANFVDSATIDFTANSSTVTAVIVPGSITASLLSALGGATAGLVLSAGPTGSFNWISNTTGAIVTVSSGTGISVNTSVGSGNATVSINNTGVVAASYGTTNSVSQVTFNLQGQATSATSVSIVLNALSNINNFTASAITSVLAAANFTDTATIDLTANSSTVNANIIVGSITASLLNASSFTSSMAGYLVSVTATGSFTYVPTGGGVTSVIAGTGISVVGTTVATVSIANTGVVTSTYGSTNSVSSVTFNLQGQAIAATAVSIVLQSGNITNFTASAISSALAAANFTDTATIDLTANSSTVNAAIIVGSITASLLNSAGGVAGATAGYILSVGTTGSFYWTAPPVSSVIAGTGISVVSNSITGTTVSINNTGVVAAQYGSTNSVSQVTFNLQGQATSATSVSIVLNALSNINNFTASAITSVLAAANFTDTATIDLTANSSTVNAAIIVNSITASLLNTNSGGATAGYVLSVGSTGSFLWVPNTVGSITSVNGGTGISVITSAGSGNATVSIANSGVVASTYGSTNSVSSVTFNLAGQAIAATAVSIVLQSGNITNFTASAISSALASANFVDSGTIDFTANSSTVTAVIVPGSITASLLSVQSGGATAGYYLSVSATGSFIWAPSSAVVGTPLYTQRNVTPTATTGNGSSTGITLTFTPDSDINVSVYLNGQLMFLGNGVTNSVDCYFGTSPIAAVAIASLVATNTLYWNGTYIGYDLDTNDRIDILYNK